MAVAKRKRLCSTLGRSNNLERCQMRHHGNTARSPKTSHKPIGKHPAPQPQPKPAIAVRPPHVPKIAVVSREQIFGGEICEVYMPKRGRRGGAAGGGRGGV